MIDVAMTESSKVAGVRKVNAKDSEKVLPQRKMHSNTHLVSWSSALLPCELH